MQTRFNWINKKSVFVANLFANFHFILKKEQYSSKHYSYRKEKSPIFRGLQELVRITGVEPARVFPLEPKSSASANSAISACYTKLCHNFSNISYIFINYNTQKCINYYPLLFTRYITYFSYLTIFHFLIIAIFITSISVFNFEILQLKSEKGFSQLSSFKLHSVASCLYIISLSSAS